MLITARELMGHSLQANDGLMGKADDLLFDDRNWIIRYIVANTGNWLRDRLVLLGPESFAPLAAPNRIAVRLSREQIEQSPPLEADKPLDRRKEEQLRRYYAWTPYWGTPIADPTRPDVFSPDEAAALAVASGHPPPTAVAVRDSGDPNLRSIKDVAGYLVEGTDGELGKLHDFVVDTGVWALRYAVIDTAAWLPGRKVLIGSEWIREIDWEDQAARMELKRPQLQSSPVYDPFKPIDRTLEEELKAHYGSPQNFA